MDNDRKILTVEELAKELRISRSLAYRQVREGKIYSIKCGDRYLIPKRSLDQLLSGGEDRGGGGVRPAITRGESGTVTISVVDSQGKRYGTQPLEIDVIDAAGARTDFSDYYATQNGEYRLNITPALNDAAGTWTVTVHEMTSGIEERVSFEIR